MLNIENGQGQEPSNDLPALRCIWNEETQQVGLQFDNKVFKSWTFIMWVLDEAKRKAEEQYKMGIARMAQQQMMEMQRDAMVAAKLRGH